jgi:hypothetical protein
VHLTGKIIGLIETKCKLSVTSLQNRFANLEAAARALPLPEALEGGMDTDGGFEFLSHRNIQPPRVCPSSMAGQRPWRPAGLSETAGDGKKSRYEPTPIDKARFQSRLVIVSCQSSVLHFRFRFSSPSTRDPIIPPACGYPPCRRGARAFIPLLLHPAWPSIRESP